MRVFISWSGERSKLLATALREFIQPILQSVEVWMSEADIYAGDRWSDEIARELASSNFGIICVTPENMNAPWLLFESGALAKSLEGSRVIPFLFDLEMREISGPLAQFQAKRVDHTGLMEVVDSINKSLSAPISDTLLRPLLEAMWPRLEQKLLKIPQREADPKKSRSQADILEELVTGVRNIDIRLRETETALNDSGPRLRPKKGRLPISIIMDELSRIEGNEPIAFLVLAGLLREEVPWISEILTEGYRTLKKGSYGHAMQLVEQIERLVTLPFVEEFGGTKQQQMMLYEVPRFLSYYVTRFREKHISRPDRPNLGDPSL